MKTAAEMSFVVASYEAWNAHSNLLTPRFQFCEYAIDLALFFHGGELAIHIVVKEVSPEA